MNYKIETIEGIGKVMGDKLRASGVADTAALLAKTSKPKDREALAARPWSLPKAARPQGDRGPRRCLASRRALPARAPARVSVPAGKQVVELLAARVGGAPRAEPWLGPLSVPSASWSPGLE
jgi:hypothetical protein